jgi:outer membrane receptor for ferrienterochelin and colicins
LQFNKQLWERHIVTVGADYRDDFHQHQLVFEPSSGTVFTDASRTRQSYGIFAQGNFTLLTNVHLNAGVRYDQYGHFDPAFSPRVALIYNPWEKSSLKAIYGTAFRAPNFLELSDPRFQNIRPEEITSYELVYEQEIGRFLRSSVSGYYNQMHDLIVLRNGSFTNFDADTRGLELALEGNWTNGLRTRLSYTLQKTQDRSDRDLPDSPENLVKLNVSVPVYREKVFAGLEFQYTSTRQTIFTTSTGGTIRGVNAAGFWIVNFTLFSRELVRNVEFSGTVYNLFDYSYGDPSSRFHQQDIIGQDGRSFRVKLTYRF